MAGIRSAGKRDSAIAPAYMHTNPCPMRARVRACVHAVRAATQRLTCQYQLEMTAPTSTGPGASASSSMSRSMSATSSRSAASELREMRLAILCTGFHAGSPLMRCGHYFYTHAHIRFHTNTHTHTDTHARTHARTYTHTHTGMLYTGFHAGSPLMRFGRRAQTCLRRSTITRVCLYLCAWPSPTESESQKRRRGGGHGRC